MTSLFEDSLVGDGFGGGDDDGLCGGEEARDVEQKTGGGLFGPFDFLGLGSGLETMFMFGLIVLGVIFLLIGVLLVSAGKYPSGGVLTVLGLCIGGAAVFMFSKEHTKGPERADSRL